MAIDIGKIRNVGVVGHGGVGKTSLVEAMLFTAGAVTRLGTGGRRHAPPPTSIPTRSSARSRSTPRWPTATGRATASTSSTRPGTAISSPTRGPVCGWWRRRSWSSTRWPACRCRPRRSGSSPREYDLPRAVVVNRLDRERADFFRTLESLGRRLKGRLVPVHVPVGEESGFRGYVDLVTQKATVYADGKASEAEIPAELADRVKEYREKLVEAAAETDDDLLTKYLEEGSLGGGRDAQGAARRASPRARSFPSCARRRAKDIGSHAAARPDRGRASRRRSTAARWPAPTSRPSRPAYARRGRQGPGDRAGVQDAQRSPHRQAVALPGRAPARSRADSTLLNACARRPRAHGTHRLAPGQERRRPWRRWDRARSAWCPS